MAAKKDEGRKVAPAKTITHNLTRGAAALLKDYLPKALWYKEQPLSLVSAAIDANQNQLSEVESLPLPKDQETLSEYRERIKPQAREKVVIELTEDERKACRECVKEHLRHGVWELTEHVQNLITELEVR